MKKLGKVKWTFGTLNLSKARGFVWGLSGLRVQMFWQRLIWKACISCRPELVLADWVCPVQGRLWWLWKNNPLFWDLKSLLQNDVVGKVIVDIVRNHDDRSSLLRGKICKRGWNENDITLFRRHSSPHRQKHYPRSRGWNLMLIISHQRCRQAIQR